MTEERGVEGRCLCGAVTIALTRAPETVEVCHCNMCRRWGGGPLLAVHVEAGLTVEGEDNVTVYDSSDWAQRGFCRHCGTHLYYRLKATGAYALPAGLLGDLPAATMDLQIFVDEQPPWYAFANDTKCMTGAEVFEKYASPDTT